MAQRKFSFKQMLATALVTATLSHYWAYPIADIIRKFKYRDEQIPRIELKYLTPESHPPFTINDYYSPNFTKTNKRKIDTIVLHTTEGSGIGALAGLTNPNNLNGRVSAHYLVVENGGIIRLVQEKDVAWHCKKGFNNRSIGIEFAGYHDKQLTSAQITNGAKLIRNLLNKYKLGKRAIKPYSELDPTRKKDPSRRNLEQILSRIN